MKNQCLLAFRLYEVVSDIWKTELENVPLALHIHAEKDFQNVVLACNLRI